MFATCLNARGCTAAPMTLAAAPMNRRPVHPLISSPSRCHSSHWRWLMEGQEVVTRPNGPLLDWHLKITRDASASVAMLILCPERNQISRHLRHQSPIKDAVRHWGDFYHQEIIFQSKKNWKLKILLNWNWIIELCVKGVDVLGAIINQLDAAIRGIASASVFHSRNARERIVDSTLSLPEIKGTDFYYFFFLLLK